MISLAAEVRAINRVAPNATIASTVAAMIASGARFLVRKLRSSRIMRRGPEWAVDAGSAKGASTNKESGWGLENEMPDSNRRECSASCPSGARTLHRVVTLDFVG